MTYRFAWSQNSTRPLPAWIIEVIWPVWNGVWYVCIVAAICRWADGGGALAARWLWAQAPASRRHAQQPSQSRFIPSTPPSSASQPGQRDLGRVALRDG